MAETFDCRQCNSTVEITEIRSYPDYTERILSCGHKSRLFVRAIHEPTISVSDTVTAVVSRFKQSQRIIVKEKNYGNLEFSGDDVNVIINNSTINIYNPDTKVSQYYGQPIPNNIIDKVQTIREEVKSSSNLKEKQQILSLIERITTIISAGESMKSSSKFTRFKESISRKKWVFSMFSMATPYILKIIEVLTDKQNNH